MKTIIFVVLIIASASYLVIGDKSPLSVSADGSTVSVDIEKVSSDVSKQLNEKVTQQLASFKDEMTQNQQRQIEALQQSVVNLAQKSAKLERQLAGLKQQSEPVQSEPMQHKRPQPEPVEESQITNSLITAQGDGPDVGAISQPVDYDNMNVAIDNDNSQTIAQVNEVADNHSDMAMMDKQQRRKRLQKLSERMTLKSLGVEK